MTPEDKQLIADYMDWDGTTTVEGYAIDTPELHHFDLNDASLCVQEMQKRGDWGAFMNYTWSRRSATWPDLQDLQVFVAHIFNAENYFGAFVEWLKERK